MDYIYTYIHILMYVYMYVCMYVYMYMCIYVYIIRMYICIYVHVCKNICSKRHIDVECIHRPAWLIQMMNIQIHTYPTPVCACCIK